MASAAWLHGPSITRLTEGLVSVLKEDRPEYLPALLANYREHGVVGTQSTGAVGGLVGISNTRLGSSKTRFEGLCLLSVLVKDSSSEVFQQHCLSWLRTLQQVIQSQSPLPTVQLAVSVLQDLLQYSSQLPELAREVGLNSILGILTSLLSLKSECHLAAMKGMMACMIYYPRACGSLREKLGAYFLSKMDSDNPKVQEVACECYGRLPCLGGVLERGGGGHKAEGWTNQLHGLLASANSILGQLYQGTETEGTVQYEGPGVELPFAPLDDVDPLLILQLHHRYKAICLAIKHTLSVDPASSVRLPVQNVLNLVCRALAVNTKSISPTGEGCLKLLVLPSIHNDTLELLSALIKAVGGGLVQYSSVLTRLFSQSLSAWTPLPEASLGQQRAYSAVRVAVYRIIELWVRVGGVSLLQGSPSHTELLFTHLMGDITPGSEAVKLRSGQQSSMTDLIGSAGKSGPRRTKGIGDGMSLQRKGDVLANQDTCVAALRALRQIILTSGTLLKEDLHKRIQDLVVPLCVRLQQQAHCLLEVGAVSGQYGSPTPRRELYRLLLALVLVPSPRWPPSLSCAVSIFSHGRRDRNIMVSSFCAEALTICNTLIHPRTPSISLPLTPLTLKSTASAPVLASGQNPSLTIPTLLGGATTGPPFPARHPMGLGPATLLGSLENHLPLAPSVLPTPAGTMASPGDLLLSPSQPGELAGFGAPESQRQVFVRYDKEEPEDVEISLESDSDDSVVIMPAGMMMEMQDGAANAQSLSQPPVSVVGGLQPSVPVVGEVGSVDTSLTNELPTSIPHQILPANVNNINSFPGPSQTAQLVSLVPPLNSTAASLSASPAGLADSLTGGPQLQQMLMQNSPGGQPPTLGLSLQMQLQNQIAQTSRQLQPQPPGNDVDQNVININSSDDEEDDEEELEDEELGEEEEEEGLEEEEEEEEGSDFLDDEYCEAEDFDDYEDEEGEDEDEEESEEIQPLEGDDDRGMMGEEEPEVMFAAEEQQGMEMFCMEGEREVDAGIEEMEGVRSVYADDRIKEKGTVEEIENIGAVERNEAVVGKQQIETLVIGGDAEGLEEDNIVEAVEPEVRTCEQEVARPEDHEEEAGPSQQGQELPVEGQVQEQETELQPEEKNNPNAPSTTEQEVLQSADDTVKEEKESGEQGDDADARGTKRKMGDREEGESAEQGIEKKKEGNGQKSGHKHAGQKDDEVMASMLADFVDCPPDDDDRSASQSQP
ncbi:proline-, glutamic acid- and leucine-rich protein 1 isoform X1 [Rhinichthys klamathensis goyatoka]|uniref:proline-, glutamic acid- and leucine-rich protein 1 isoform X1 n=1 Tax=Rhinichthys klamathensis goyatoka TaxID=3034132 RepID=UPI0024B5C6C3|nr:proline-, glutamic acid- and leucine-rich protein 1 isoform X1 [Rhinichthys klamathensis goyatoka]